MTDSSDKTLVYMVMTRFFGLDEERVDEVFATEDGALEYLKSINSIHIRRIMVMELGR